MYHTLYENGHSNFEYPKRNLCLKLQWHGYTWHVHCTYHCRFSLFCSITKSPGICRSGTGFCAELIPKWPVNTEHERITVGKNKMNHFEQMLSKIKGPTYMTSPTQRIQNWFHNATKQIHHNILTALWLLLVVHHQSG